jgi:hypothetical protein
LLIVMLVNPGCSVISDFGDYRFGDDGADGGSAGNGGNGGGAGGESGGGGEGGTAGGPAGTGGEATDPDGGQDAGIGDAGEHLDYYLFSSSNTTGTGYHVYDAAGQYLEEITAETIGISTARISALYYDWGVKRYAYHDGYGQRRGGRIYEYEYEDFTGSDSQGYGRSLGDTAPAVLPGPIFTTDIGGWADAGILIRPVRDVRLENFLFNNQGNADTIKLVEHETEDLLESIALTPTSSNQVILAGWDLKGGVEYRLISEHGSNGRYAGFNAFPVANPHLEVLSTVNQYGNPEPSYWFTFSHLVTTPL